MCPHFHPHVLCHANETCPVAGHDLLISLFTLHTRFNIMQFIVVEPMQFDHLLQTAETAFISFEDNIHKMSHP